MTQLILMRHGNTFEPGQIPVQVGARTDLPLTAYGRQQAEKMAHYLRLSDVKIEAIYSGNLKRQKQSAQIIAQVFGLEVLEESALTEIDYGLWEGLQAKEIVDKWPLEYRQWLEGKWQSSIFGKTHEWHWSALENWLNRIRKSNVQKVLAISSNGLLRFFHNEKVKTGHFCEIDLLEDGFKIQKWNIDPQYGELCKHSDI